MSKLNRPLILFDGDCNLCNALVKFVLKRDPEQKFLFATIQSNTGQVNLKSIGFPLNYCNSFVYIKSNRYFIKSEAALALLKDIGGPWKLGYVFVIIPKPIRDWAYDVIARNRFKILDPQKHCLVQTPKIKQQFLD
jgi:predicted DCC family thiol-disulfide oxidoreductase YuxK